MPSNTISNHLAEAMCWPKLNKATRPSPQFAASMSARDIFKTIFPNSHRSVTTIEYEGRTPPSRDYNLFTVEPLSESHTQTFILLHGSGDSPDQFGAMLLATSLYSSSNSKSTATTFTAPTTTLPLKSDAQTLRTAFPHARFIFPGAPTRDLARWTPRRMTRWFDWWSVQGVYDAEGRGERDDVQADGLREVVALVHALIRREAEELKDHGGLGSVVLGGLSNGCAATLASLVLWDGPRLGGFLGMSGWMPYGGRISRLAFLKGRVAGSGDELLGGGDNQNNESEGGAGTGAEEEERDGDGEGKDSKSAQRQRLEKARAWLKAEINFTANKNENDNSGQSVITQAQQQDQQHDQTPIFLGHGVKDPVIPVAREGEAANALRRFGFEVTTEMYPELGHWYSQQMLGDFFAVAGKWSGVGGGFGDAGGSGSSGGSGDGHGGHADRYSENV